MLIFAIVATVLAAATLTLASAKTFQIYQLSSYRAKGYFDWVKRTRFDYFLRYFSATFFAVVAMFVFRACFADFGYVKLVGFAFMLLFGITLFVVTLKERKKTPLKLTHRMIRLIAVSFIINAAVSFLLLWLGGFTPLGYSFFGFGFVLSPFTVTAAHFVLLPIEMLINRSFRKKAKRKLSENENLIKIGITGSYGKTTAKNVLSAMLSKKYDTLATPLSYNTPMGICKTVLSDLTDKTEVFVAEMGARHVGDVAELVRLVEPSVALITAVGEQHLSEFGSAENIAKTKYELVQGLKDGGKAFFNGENQIVKEMYDKTENAEKYLTGNADGAFASYSDVKVDENGVSFTLKIGNETAPVHTHLLGKYIPSTVALCAAAASVLGVSLEDIAAAVESLEPVPHRLQLSESNGMVIIDDAYNSNPEGAAAALEVLASLDKYKVIITPGMVELGERESELNEELGVKIGKTCDYAFFMGDRAEALKKGALRGGMNENEIAIVAGVTEAVNMLGSLPGRKAVLFENDLPDNL